MISETRDNNFNILRLLFASLVIVSHSPELVDGNRSREILTSIFGTLSFGDVAVDGFFLISGFLITKSFITSQSVGEYVTKRVLRIYPAFLVCFLLCISVVAYFADASMPTIFKVIKQLCKAFLLASPTWGTEFEGLHYPGLNGSTWTIAYEFRCYLLVAVLGVAGLLKRPWIILIFTLFLLALNATKILAGIGLPFSIILGTLPDNVRLIGVFLAGSLFYLYREYIPYRADLAAVCAALLAAFMFLPFWAEGAFIILGGYLIFWFSFAGPFRSFSAGLKNDVSYGLYLYAWPVQSLVIYHIASISPVYVTLITLPITAFLGWISWKFIEKPALRLKKRP